jgi:hypothetical protein
MAIGPEPDVAVAHPEVGGLALVLAGGAGRDGFELRPDDVAGWDIPAWHDAGFDEQHGPTGLRHDRLINENLDVARRREGVNAVVGVAGCAVGLVVLFDPDVGVVGRQHHEPVIGERAGRRQEQVVGGYRPARVPIVGEVQVSAAGVDEESPRPPGPQALVDGLHPWCGGFRHGRAPGCRRAGSRSLPARCPSGGRGLRGRPRRWSGRRPSWPCRQPSGP